MAKRIVIMAGGTGGHVFPALAVAEYLRDQGWQVSWMGTHKGMESRVVPAQGFEIDWLGVTGLRGKGWLTLCTMPGMLLTACWQARKILLERQPQVILGMGGFVAGPGGLMAKLLGIPLVIHEQNRIPGTTNRLLARWADKVLQAFPASFADDVNAVLTGNPLRKAFNDVSAEREITQHTGLHILVMGGSLGAQCLNEVVPKALSLLTNIEVRHQTGEAMCVQVSEAYAKYQLDAQVVTFIENVVEAYRWADLVICRAGAMTISELAAMGLPAILVPYPYAIDDHQSANAQYLVDAGAAIMISQDMLNTDYLVEKINQVIPQLSNMSKAAKDCAQLTATQLVAERCLQEAV